MRKRGWIYFIVIILGCCWPLLAQFTPEEIAERERWEEFLGNAEVMSESQMDGRLAVTNPWVITLEKDGITERALWKNPSGRMKGYLEGWRWEIAAYRLDKFLGLNMVPPTVERKFHYNSGSCQLWTKAMMDLRKKAKEKIKPPSYKLYYWNRAIYLQRAFDNLIANEDRHQGNILITDDWRMILIDHSRSFRTSGKFTKKLIYTKNHREGPKEMKQLPRRFVEKLKELTSASIKDVAGEYLNDKEINAILLRRDLILKDVASQIKKKGEDKVLY